MSLDTRAVSGGRRDTEFAGPSAASSRQEPQLSTQQLPCFDALEGDWAVNRACSPGTEPPM